MYLIKIAKLDENTQELDEAFEAIGGADEFQQMLDEIPEDSKKEILGALQIEHQDRMSEIMKSQENAGKMMDDGLKFMWKPKFVFDKAMKNHEGRGVNDPAFDSSIDALVTFGSGANILVGWGTALTGSIKHFSSRLKEIGEVRRHDKAVQEAGSA